jgi:hypothetical protein
MAMWLIAISLLLLAASVTVYVYHHTRQVAKYALVHEDEVDQHLDDGWLIYIDVDGVILLEDGGYAIPMVKYVD